MNLILRPLEDPNGVTWSIIWMMILLLAGVFYYVYTILQMAYAEEDQRQETCTYFDCFTDDNVIFYHSCYSECCDENEHY